MIEALSGFLSSLKQTSPVIFLGLSIATGIILFSGDSVIIALGLEEFRNNNKGYLGAIFIGSLSILLSYTAFSFVKIGKEQYRKYHSKIKQKEKLKKQQEQLHKLTPDEKAYLIPYVLNDENTQYFLIEDGVAGGLVAKGMIYQSSSIGSMLEGFAYNIQPWVKEYLQEHPECLEGANPNPSGPPRW